MRASQLWAPRHWPSWLVVGLMRCVALLPHPLLIALGRNVGWLYGRLLPYRARIAETNIALCFPEYTPPESKMLLARHLEAVGIALVETMALWWIPAKRLKGLGRIEGLEHIDAALAAGKGAMLVSAHFTPLDISGRLLCRERPVDVTYRELRNPVFEKYLNRSRREHYRQVLARNDFRRMVRTLRENHLLWYAADQDLGARQSVFAPFFGIPAATLTTTTRLARLSGAPVLFYSAYRDQSGVCRITITPPFERFPSPDGPEADATLFNRKLEEAIRKAPEQYLWIHRRFKTRPPGEPKLYPPKPRRHRWYRLKQERLTGVELARLLEGTRLLERSPLGDKVRETEEGEIIKFFYRKRFISSAMFRSYARRFCMSCRRLRARGVPAPEPLRMIHDRRRRRHLVVYRKLPGFTLRELLQRGAEPDSQFGRFATFLAGLHARGIYFRSVHLGNILVMPGGQFGLIDVAATTFCRGALRPRRRARNFRHLLHDAGDRRLLSRYGYERFVQEYSDAAGYSTSEAATFRRLVPPLRVGDRK